LPSGSVEDFSNQNGFSGLDQDEEEGSWQDEQNEGIEQKGVEEEVTDDGEIFLSVEESAESGHHQQQQVSFRQVDCQIRTICDASKEHLILVFHATRTDCLFMVVHKN
jgi:hypothetical protein